VCWTALKGEPVTSILHAFGTLGWHGIGDNGK